MRRGSRSLRGFGGVPKNMRKTVDADAWAWERLSPFSRVPWYPDIRGFTICVISDAVVGMGLFQWSSQHSKIWVGMQEHTESTTAFAFQAAGKAILQDWTLVSRLPFLKFSVQAKVHAKLAKNALYVPLTFVPFMCQKYSLCATDICLCATEFVCH